MVSDHEISGHQGEPHKTPSFSLGTYRICQNLDDENFCGRYFGVSPVSVYPVVALQIIVRTGIRSGICLDLGSGPAPLAIALARASDLQIFAVDSSETALSLVPGNIVALSLEDRIIPLLADVHMIPFGDGVCDLVVSRGSYHLWEDLPVALAEIYRILKTGGKAYVGGGYGSLNLRDRMYALRRIDLNIDDPDFSGSSTFYKYSEEEIWVALDDAGIRNFRIINDESGFWMLIEK